MNVINAITGLLGGGALLGGGSGSSSADRYYKKQAQLTGLMADQYRAYVPQLNSLLLRLSQDHGMTAADLAAQRQAEDDTHAYYRQALAKLLLENDKRGMNTSLQAQNATQALARSQADTLAKARVDQLATQEARKWKALQLLTGTAGGSGKNASDSYNQLGDAYSANANSLYRNLATVLAAVLRNS